MTRKTIAAALAALSLGICAAPALSATYGGIQYDGLQPFPIGSTIYGESWYEGTATATGYFTTHLMRRFADGSWGVAGTRQFTMIRGVRYNGVSQVPVGCQAGQQVTVRSQARFASGPWDISATYNVKC